MKLFQTIIFLLTPIVFLISSCSEEIKPSMDGKETAVLYCVLNEKDSLHYIKLTKAVNASGDMTQTALIPDSSYFENVEITIKEYTSGTVTRTWKSGDASSPIRDTIITNKDPGVFYSPEQKLYYFRTSSANPLKSTTGVVYKLEAKINNGEFTVKGETSLVGGMNIIQPTTNSNFKFASSNISLYGYSSTVVGFNTGTAKRVEVLLQVSFEEFENNNLVNTVDFDWKLADIDQEDIESNMTSSASGQLFYELIKQNATNNPNITKRKLKGINIRINGASNDLQKYLLLNKPSSSLAQTKVSYTNLTATNDMRVIGIFASRYHAERFKAKWVSFAGNILGCLDNYSMRELCQGSITGSLLFCSDNPADNAESYFCN